ncbi:MAG: MFS transporter [Verrucomicrobia bacterium]|nr:MFS transporter [Verrucomicrobiota bacterium]
MAYSPDNSSAATPAAPWYAGVTRYQWLVLAIASAGWVFDTFEGQIFNLTRGDLFNDLLRGQPDLAAQKQLWGDRFLGVFLLGGTLGGIGFGMLADRWGRRPTMVVTILMYSVFSGLTYFATELWQVGALRFLVAMGVGGEWAVAAALVAEVFPAKARAHAGGIFHATSVLGTWLATGVAVLVGTHWQYAFLAGVIPALLVLWVRASVKESESWQQKKSSAQQAEELGSLRELLTDPRWARRALLGMLLAAVGLATFWSVTIAGQDLARAQLLKDGVPAALAADQAKTAYGFWQTAGGGLGLLAFGPLCVRLGRKRAFALMHVAAFLSVLLVCFAPSNFDQLFWLLPLFGFCTLSVHAGYAIYFPELFPTRLRGTGTGFCFNGGRLLAAPTLFYSGTLKSSWLAANPGLELRHAIALLGGLFLVGLIVIAFLPETKDQPLPE